MFVNSLLLFCLFSFSVLVVLMLMLMLLMLMLCYTGKYTVSIASFQLHGALRVLHINERTTPMQAHSEALNKFTCTTSKQNTHTHTSAPAYQHTKWERMKRKKIKPENQKKWKMNPKNKTRRERLAKYCRRTSRENVWSEDEKSANKAAQKPSY